MASRQEIFDRAVAGGLTSPGSDLFERACYLAQGDREELAFVANFYGLEGKGLGERACLAPF